MLIFILKIGASLFSLLKFLFGALALFNIPNYLCLEDLMNLV